ncbi:NADH-quinone oxidoreductase subunit C [Novosphingobium resinovorum]|uniref:NADH-quinone oxidoreductase subunit C n=1 Tax=Novosphingobium TaxID=165696 RepID=UPI001B3C80BF|nr:MULTISPECIES: NADH-quinone oxidoreductase subunit C [Novosphingobium]MBF7013858.1 NADH-quinone oxidoreductase subunit C [Novosphingobium sp. HR1a]WJM26003.1 NADH-quinone oxidoreductase subunit C [Novosphingobium resinovorum]
MIVLHSAPRFSSNEGVRDKLVAALGAMVTHAQEENGEIVLTVARAQIATALRIIRDEHAYQQLMDIAGVDYPARAERFEVVYMLLSVTRNHRLIVKVAASETTAVPTVTTLWPNAGWLEREVFDMYGVIFAGNPDLRRILTDYGFEGHPFRKDFPLTGYVELRYSKEDQRVVYEPVDLQQDLRTFDFMSPWEGADYVLPGDEKAAPSPAMTPKTTDAPKDTGAGEATDRQAAHKVASAARTGTIAGQGLGDPVQEELDKDAPGAPNPTGARPDRGPTGGANAREGSGPAPEGS